MVNFKGKDQIEFGHKPYAESSYGDSPGATPTTLYRIGYVTEMRPSFDPEHNRVFVLREGSDTGKPLGVYTRRENVRLGLKWLQGQVGDYFQKYLLGGYNFFAEAKLYRDATDKLYLYWTGLKLDTLSVQCSIGEPVLWTAELIGKLYDSKDTTIHSYGASPGTPWEWDDTYVQVSTNGSDWTTIDGVTDWEFRVDNQLKPNFVFNSTGSKQLSSLEEMEQLCDARLTMNLQDDTYLSYLLDQTELYLKAVLPNSQYIQFSKGKLKLLDPVVKPEDLIACRVEYTGGYLQHSFT
ncbi:MAG: hypothetical protein NWE89_01240 [Candidatus Bathyarchaeota archaeon]|nr:hypothetical protein [Candidatus Bathyarchaeota archaeon]